MVLKLDLAKCNKATRRRETPLLSRKKKKKTFRFRQYSYGTVKAAFHTWPVIRRA